jgi:hypothetical protein
MARPTGRSPLSAVLHVAYKALVVAIAAGLFWMAGLAAIAGLTTAPGFLGFGFVLAFIALAIAYLGWREA